MARQDILLIGLEYNSLRILEVSLRKAGFMVASVSSYSEAFEQIRIAPPDLIIIDSTRDSDAFEFSSSVKNEYRNIPVIIISSNKEINTRIRALEIGIDDYLVKPIYIKEIVARIKIHLQKREQKRVEDGITAGFIGSLSDIGLYDIIQTIELNKKSGILEIKGKIQEGRIYFKNGQMVHAHIGKLRGEYAVYRMLTFSEGVFKMSFLDIDVEPDIDKPNSAIIMEGMRRLDEYMKYTEQLPPLTTRLDINHDVLVERLRDIPDNVNKVLKLVDNERSINDIVELSDLDELETLKIVSALYFDGIVYDVFSPKPDKERKISSTYPEPQNVLSKKEESVLKEHKRPSTSEIWAEHVFEKEVKGPVESSNIGNLTIVSSDHKETVSMSGNEKSMNVLQQDNGGLTKEGQNMPLIPTMEPPVVSIISDEKEQKTPKEQLIEKTLIENITLSTSSYVKGSLLGKDKREVGKVERRGFPTVAILLPVFILVGVGILFFGYRYFFYGHIIRGESRPTRGDIMTSKEESSPKELTVLSKESETKVVREVEREISNNTEEPKEGEVAKRNDELKEDTAGNERGTSMVGAGRGERETSEIGGKKVQAEFSVDMSGYNEFLRSAQDMYRSGNLKRAKEELKQALIKNPKGYEAFTLLGQIDLEGNKIKSAITYLKRAIGYNSKYAPAYFYLGTCYQLEGDNANAKKMYQKYLLLSPNGEFANDVRAIINDLK
ncbi:MAG: DUF4388 domain-containing protein [Deltaproteobacteria bacterium]|nr:DUF4388 domain-containing protein [Deltaproteobacteria bacterium]